VRAVALAGTSGASPVASVLVWVDPFEKRSLKKVSPGCRDFSPEPLLLSNGSVFLVRASCRNRAHNLNRELFKGRRSPNR